MGKSHTPCQGITSIDDLHNILGKWYDTHGCGTGDRSKVACNQVGVNYDELKNAYNAHYSHYHEKEIALAMCSCCKTGDISMGWNGFYDCMSNKGFQKK